MTSQNISKKIAAFAVRTRWEDLPDSVRHEAKRSLLNCISTAIAGSREPAVEKSLAVLGPFSSPGGCTVIGHKATANASLAAYINAISANVFDYDDTHQNTVIHPTAPIAPALFAHAQTAVCTGKDVITAFVVGGEIECRIGNAVSPSHYVRGWHITSTCGIFGAAAGVGRLIGLNADQQVAALANATAQSAGMVETLGTMSKSISVGNASRGGLHSALLAQVEFSGPPDPLTGERGFISVYSDTPNPDQLTTELGERWEIATNTYKPYPTGIVLHPVIEACIEYYHNSGLRAEDVAHVELTAHPLLRERADRPDVTTGTLSQVSVQHSIAIALRRGKAGLAEFTDAAAVETQTDGIRPKVEFNDEPSRAIESVKILIVTQGGERYESDIAYAKGGPGNPMTDLDLEQKLADLIEYRDAPLNAKKIVDAVWSLDRSKDAGALMRLLEA